MNVDHAEKRILCQSSSPRREGVLRSGAKHPKVFKSPCASPIPASSNLSVGSANKGPFIES